MQTIENGLADSGDEVGAGKCPVQHGVGSQQKTARVTESVGVPVERDEAGIWHVRGFEEARTVLRSGDTRQAGFKAEMMPKTPQMTNRPILFMDGKEHHQQRKMTARYFAPKVVSTSYRDLMERQADRLIERLQRTKRVDLSQLTLDFASRVAAEVVGLTSSRLPGMAQRLEAFFDNGLNDLRWNLRTLIHLVKMQSRSLLFLWLDVKPAIQARKKKLQEDVISHLITQKYGDLEILLECITYAAAGMVTTREFISVALWHFLEQPELRERYLAVEEAERYDILHEILRLEPIVGHLYRRTTAELVLESAGERIVIPEGELIDLHIYGTNADETVVGERPLELCPGRQLQGERVGTMLMSFGDGQHRCPGSYIAIQESDILLQRLLKLEGLRIERTPTVNWNNLIEAYELRKFMIAVD